MLIVIAMGDKVVKYSSDIVFPYTACDGEWLSYELNVIQGRIAVLPLMFLAPILNHKQVGG